MKDNDVVVTKVWGAREEEIALVVSLTVLYVVWEVRVCEDLEGEMRVYSADGDELNMTS